MQAPLDNLAIIGYNGDAKSCWKLALPGTAASPSYEETNRSLIVKQGSG